MVGIPRGPYRDDGTNATGSGWTVDGNSVYAPQPGPGHGHPHSQQHPHHPGTVVAPHAQGGFEYRTFGREEQVGWAPGQYYDQATVRILLLVFTIFSSLSPWCWPMSDC